jgi:hypothetical protein
MIYMDADKLKSRFPSRIDFPAALGELCAWHETNGSPISGYFELYADEHDSITHWFGTDAVADRLAVFGSGPDGSLYCIWRQEDGRQPIVHLGSEGLNNFVLAGNMVDFIRLLAAGYGELGFEDLAEPPEPGGVNPRFQEWVRRTFVVTIPKVGAEIVDPAKRGHEDLEGWIEKVIAGSA